MSKNKTNVVSINKICDDIKEHLSEANIHWKQIAQLVYTARENYFADSTDTQAFKHLCGQTGFAKSTICKLAMLGEFVEKGDRRVTHEYMNSVHAWTTLYEATTLTEEQFDRLIHTAEQNAISARGYAHGSVRVTRGMILALKNEGVQKQSDDYVTVFTVKVDANAMRADRFSTDEYARLVELLAEIQSISYTRVDDNRAYDSRQSAYVSEIEAARRSQRDAYISRLIQRIKECMTARGLKKHFNREWLQELGKVDLAELEAEALRHDQSLELRTEADFIDEAKRLWNEKNKKLVEKINEEYRYANTSVTASESNESENDDVVEVKEAA